MPRLVGGGGGSNLFTTNFSSSGTVGVVLYVQMSNIPSGLRMWFGSAQYSSPSKSITFEIRTNSIGKSAGTDADTIALSTAAVSIRSGTVTIDMYKNGTISTMSVVGTGVEKVWLKLKSKTNTAGDYIASINYTVT